MYEIIKLSFLVIATEFSIISIILEYEKMIF